MDIIHHLFVCWAPFWVIPLHSVSYGIDNNQMPKMDCLLQHYETLTVLLYTPSREEVCVYILKSDYKTWRKMNSKKAMSDTVK